jgi:hypothetical protein
MLYNILVSGSSGKFNIFGVSEDKMSRLIDAYLDGDDSVTLSGKRYLLNDVSVFRIFCHDEAKEEAEKTIYYYMNNRAFYVNEIIYRYLPVKTLRLIGKEVTEDYIGDQGFGERSKHEVETKDEESNILLVNESRINELRGIRHIDYDLTRLIKLCEEINYNFINENYLSVGMIGRTILNHIPPIFGFKSFEEIANNYGSRENSRSFKKLMQNLNLSLKNIADMYLHQTIRKSETLPNRSQIDFGRELDILLEEIVRILKN